MSTAITGGRAEVTVPSEIRRCGGTLRFESSLCLLANEKKLDVPGARI